MNTVFSSRWLSFAAGMAYTTLSRSTLKRLVATGRLKAYRPSGAHRGRVLLERSELDRLIKSGRCDSAAQEK
jgi:excisionase family DNA binding protein